MRGHRWKQALRLTSAATLALIALAACSTSDAGGSLNFVASVAPPSSAPPSSASVSASTSASGTAPATVAAVTTTSSSTPPPPPPPASISSTPAADAQGIDP